VRQGKATGAFGKIAVIVVDMQNDFLRRGAPTELPPGRRIVPKLRRLLHSARACGYPVFHLVTYHRKDGLDLENLEKIRGQLHCVEGSGGAQIVRGLRPAQGDLVVVKRRYSGFYQTTLDMLLRRLGVGIVVLTGVATNGCVLATALDAYFRDYWVVIPSDCVQAGSRDLHKAGLAITKYLIGPTPSSSLTIRFFRYYRTDEVDPGPFLTDGLLVRRRHDIRLKRLHSAP
jgi:biuret amidohydrolase